MNLNIINIALFADDEDRASYLNQLANNNRRKIVSFNFKDLSNKYISFDDFDLLIFDFTTSKNIDVKNINFLRTEKKILDTPFLYVLNEWQLSEADVLKNHKPSSIIQDPFSEIEIESIIRNLLSLGDLQKRQDFNKELIDSEKKLIYQLDKILQLTVLSSVSSINDFCYQLQDKITHKIELTFAAEKSLFLQFDAENHFLILNKYKIDSNEVENQKKFYIKNSRVNAAIIENSPMILDKEMLLDPFIQELEETNGFEINSLLFLPITVLHQVKGVFLIINKLHRQSFTENDLALSLIISSKIIYRMENIILKNLDLDNLSAIVTPDFLSETENYEDRLSKDILDSIGFGLLIFDQKYKINYANSFAKKTLNVKGKKTFSLRAVLGEEAFDIIDNLLKNRDVPLLRQEILVNHPENRQLYLGYSLYNISHHPENIIYALTFMEISQTKRLQAEIIRMDRMASLGVLASGIAHEIRNPLAGIKAMAQTLQEELEEGDTKNEYLERIVRQVNRLDELLKSFFSYARPQRPNPVRSKIPEIVHEVLPLFRRKIKENNIIVKEVYSRDLKEIFVDFHQIEQVFFNLIINAIDSMKEGGTLMIRARLPEETQPIIDRRQRIPKLFSDIYNEITISDTGLGMDNETLNNMYNPFFTTKPNGTGLGLSIVYQIILEHGGQITVGSTINKGTSFKILLPVYIKDSKEK